MSELNVDIRAQGAATVVSFTGEAGVMNEDALKGVIDRLRRLHPKRLVLDLAALTFISSLAIGLFVSLEREMKTQGGQVTIAAANSEVGKVISRCKLDAIMPVFDRVEDAIG